jgi:MFS family permease
MGITVGERQVFGLFLSPISAELGLGREVFAFGMGLMNLVWGLAAPFAGAVADRYGAGRVAVLGGVLYAVGLAAMTSSGEGGQLVLGGLLVGGGLSCAGFTVVLGAVGRAAPDDRRTAALGLASMGGSIGQFIALPYAHVLIDGFGWSVSLLVLALTTMLVVPLAAGIRGKTESLSAAATQTVAEAFREACGHRGFWLLTAGFFVCGFHLAFVAVHLPAYLDDKGMPSWLAAAALTVVGACNIVGTYLCGYFGQIFEKKNVLSALYLLRALIFLLFLMAPVSEVSVLAFGAAMGFLWLGTVPLTSGLVAQIFGPAYLSMLFGIVFLSHQVGGFLGAWLAGYLYDLFGTYNAMWWISVALGVMSAALHMPIDERPVPRFAAAR